MQVILGAEIDSRFAIVRQLKAMGIRPALPCCTGGKQPRRRGSRRQVMHADRLSADLPRSKASEEAITKTAVA